MTWPSAAGRCHLTRPGLGIEWHQAGRSGAPGPEVDSADEPSHCHPWSERLPGQPHPAGLSGLLSAVAEQGGSDARSPPPRQIDRSLDSPYWSPMPARERA
jgi:hypothetical protein